MEVLGVQIWESEQSILYGHAGTFPGYRSQMTYIPGLKVAIALQINADRFSGRLKQTIFEYVTELIRIIADDNEVK